MTPLEVLQYLRHVEKWQEVADSVSTSMGGTHAKMHLPRLIALVREALQQNEELTIALQNLRTQEEPGHDS